jgi:hypothetical protein
VGVNFEAREVTVLADPALAEADLIAALERSGFADSSVRRPQVVVIKVEGIARSSGGMT